jgi:hypothetical protein
MFIFTFFAYEHFPWRPNKLCSIIAGCSEAADSVKMGNNAKKR